MSESHAPNACIEVSSQGQPFLMPELVKGADRLAISLSACIYVDNSIMCVIDYVVMSMVQRLGWYKSMWLDLCMALVNTKL